MNKIRLIYIPFLLIAVGFISVYSLLDWLLVAELGLLNVKEELLKMWFPMSLPWIPILIWLRPRIRLLHLKSKKSDYVIMYHALAAFSIAVPTMVAQEYIFTSSGKLTQLESIKEIGSHAKTKYYQLKNFYIDKANPGVYTTYEVSGQTNQDLNITIYYVCPIFEKTEDTCTIVKDKGKIYSSSGVIGWLGLKYLRSIGNRLDQNSKERESSIFHKKSHIEFLKKNVSKFQYLERVGNSDNRDAFQIATLRSYTRPPTPSTVILTPVDEPYEQRSGSAFGWIFGSFVIGGGIWLFMILIPEFEKGQVKVFLSGKRDNKDDYAKMIEWFLPHKDYFVTPILIDLNVIVFVVMVLSGFGVISFSAQDLMCWGANYRPLTLNGEWWRLFTNIFMHGGIMHLAVNMITLLYVGIFLEPVLGRNKFIIAYLLSGILASLSSIWWYESTVSVGASGAIFGLYGVFAFLLTTKVFPAKARKSLFMSVAIFVGLNLLLGVFGGIDNAAHIGGFLSGILIGATMQQYTERSQFETRGIG